MQCLRCAGLLAALLVCSMALEARSATRVFVVARDAWLEGSRVPHNFGANNSLRLQRLDNDGWQAALIDFNRGAIRAFVAANGGHLAGARLLVTQGNSKPVDDMELSIVRNDFDWEEGTGTGREAMLGEVTGLSARHSDLDSLTDGAWQVDGVRYSDRWFMDGFKALLLTKGIRHPVRFTMAEAKPKETKALEIDPSWLMVYLSDPLARGMVLTTHIAGNFDFFAREAEGGRYAARLEITAGSEGVALQAMLDAKPKPALPAVEEPAYARRTVVFGPGGQLWNGQRVLSLKEAVGPWAYQDVSIEDNPDAPNFAGSHRIHIGDLVNENEDGEVQHSEFYGWWYMDLASYFGDPVNVAALGLPGVERAEDIKVVSACLVGGGFLWTEEGTDIEMYDIASAENYAHAGGPPEQTQLLIRQQQEGQQWTTSGWGALTDLSTFAKRANLLMPGCRIFTNDNYCQATFESDGYDYLNEQGLSVVQRWITDRKGNAGFVLRAMTPGGYGQVLDADSPDQSHPYRALGLRLELAARKPRVLPAVEQVQKQLAAKPDDLDARLAMLEWIAFEHGLQAGRSQLQAWGLPADTMPLADRVKLHRVLVLCDDLGLARRNAEAMLQQAQEQMKKEPQAYAAIEAQVIGMLLYQGWALSPDKETNPSPDWRRESLALALQACQDPARKAALQVQMASAMFLSGLYDNAMALLRDARPHAAAREPVERLAGQVEAAKAAREAQAKQQQAEREQAQRAGLRQVLRERLARAQKQGDAAAAQKIEAAIEQLK